MTKDPFIHDFGDCVRELRLERGLTQETLADRAGMHFTAIGHIERASRSSTLETILKLARALEVQPKDLIPDISPGKSRTPRNPRKTKPRRKRSKK